MIVVGAAVPRNRLPRRITAAFITPPFLRRRRRADGNTRNAVSLLVSLARTLPARGLSSRSSCLLWCRPDDTTTTNTTTLADSISIRNSQKRYYSSSISQTKAASTTTTTAKEPFYGSPRPSARPLDYHNAWDRWQLLLQQAATALGDPTRADAVAAVGELTAPSALRRLQGVLRHDATGTIILRDRPLVRKDAIPYERLMREAQARKDQKDNETSSSSSSSSSSSKESITFGQAYGSFLLQHGFDPDERDEIKYMSRDTPDDDELAYILLRYRQSHDFFHALTGLPPTVLGELGLKWLELFQTGLPLAAFSATIGSVVTLPPSEQAVLTQQYLPWALRMGRQMEFGSLLCVYYEQEWDTPLDELRARLKLEPAPIV